jgi:hypothetical protein
MRRLRQILRAVVASSLALALWTLARPALAVSAPFCDDRGASAIAPPPTLEAPDVGVRRAHITAACPGDDLPLGATLTRGRPRSVLWAVTAEPVLATLRAPFVAPPPRTLDPPPVADAPREGVHARVERPPRA